MTSVAPEYARLLRVVAVLKKRFGNLTAEELIELAAGVLAAADREPPKVEWTERAFREGDNG